MRITVFSRYGLPPARSTSWASSSRPSPGPATPSGDRAGPGLGTWRGHNDAGSYGGRPRGGAARDQRGAPRHAAYAAGQPGPVAHVAAHELGAAAYAIKAARAAAPEGLSEAVGRLECR